MTKQLGALAIAVLAFGLAPFVALASPQQDLETFRGYFEQRFPDTPFNDYVNGVYSILPTARAEWEAIEDFPPYELALSNGEEAWNTPFANGKTYADCFGSEIKGLKAKYPYFDTEAGEVKTLVQQINQCRVDNGEKPLRLGRGEIADIEAYLAYHSRGMPIEVNIPDDPRAMDWYERGKKHFYAKRGQLNFSCADCHVYNAGYMVRADTLSPALGHVSHFPVYRSRWGSMGTLHRRYAGCNRQVRAKNFKNQSEEYRALEYFHTYMSNGLAWNGPGARK
jgi:sulfur-oxidizing protein SoxA